MDPETSIHDGQEECCQPTRRQFLKTVAAGTAAATLPEALTRRPASAQSGLKTIRVAGLIGAAAHNAGLEMAKAKGFVEAEGLKFEWGEYAAGAFLIQALQAGDIVAGVAGNNPTYLGKAAGVDLKILASSNLNGSVLIVGPDIKGPKDLNGRKVATPGIAAIQDTLMLLYEEKHGIKTEHMFMKVTDMPTFLRKGEIAGYIVWEVTGSAGLAHSGGRVLATSREIREGHQCCVLLAGGKFLRSDPDAALRLVKVFDRGLKHAMRNHDELVQVIARRDLLDPSVARSALANVSYKYPPTNDLALEAFIIRALMKAGKIEKAQVPDVDKFLAETVDNRMIKSLYT